MSQKRLFYNGDGSKLILVPANRRKQLMTSHPHPDNQDQVTPRDGALPVGAEPSLEVEELLEATPAIDTLPEPNDGKINRMNFVIVAGAAALVLALGAGTAWEVFGPKASAEREAPANPDATPRLPPAFETMNTYGNQLKKYSEMDVDTFKSLPRNERLQYAQFLADWDVKLGIYDRIYGPTTGGEYALKPEQAKLTDDGQKIEEGNLFALQISYAQYSVGKNVTYSTVAGEKALSAVYWSVSGSDISKSYEVTVDDEAQLASSEYIKAKVTATDTGELMSGKKDGETVQYKIVTAHDNVDGVTMYARYFFHEFKSYDGTQKTIWLFDRSEKTLEELNLTNPS